MRIICFFLALLLGCGGPKNGNPDNVGTDPGTPDQAETTAGVLPLFDGHAHMMPTWDADTLPDLVNNHQPLGLILLGTGPTHLLQNQDESVYVACAHGHVTTDLESNQTALLQSIIGQLDSGARGIGEISIRHFSSGPNAASTPPTAWDFNHPFFLQLYQEAADRGVPLNFHYDYDGDTDVASVDDMPAHIHIMDATLPLYESVVFIWAHSGDTQPAVLDILMAAHPNLYIDISSRNPLESYDRPFPIEEQRLDEDDGTLKQSWNDLFETYPDRVLWGSDIGPAGRLEQYGEVLEYYRGILNQLTPETAAKIGYQNAMTLYGVSSP